MLVRGDDAVDETVVFELAENGYGVAEIEMTDAQDIYLALSPIDEDAQGYDYNWSRADDWEYAWSAELLRRRSRTPPKTPASPSAKPAARVAERTVAPVPPPVVWRRASAGCSPWPHWRVAVATDSE